MKINEVIQKSVPTWKEASTHFSDIDSACQFMENELKIINGDVLLTESQQQQAQENFEEIDGDNPEIGEYYHGALLTLTGDRVFAELFQGTLLKVENTQAGYVVYHMETASGDVTSYPKQLGSPVRMKAVLFVSQQDLAATLAELKLSFQAVRITETSAGAIASVAAPMGTMVKRAPPLEPRRKKKKVCKDANTEK